tara:strand:+ start:145 stop:324 length:180 start_codon:yes stop_codon:yes gene_type:complete
MNNPNEYKNHHKKTPYLKSQENKKELMEIAKKLVGRVGAAQLGDGIVIVDTNKYKVTEK